MTHGPPIQRLPVQGWLLLTLFIGPNIINPLVLMRPWAKYWNTQIKEPPRPLSTAAVTVLHEFVFWLRGLMYFSLAFSIYHKHEKCLPKEFTRISKHIQLSEACFGSNHTGCVTFFGHHSCLLSSSSVCLIELRALSHLTWEWLSMLLSWITNDRYYPYKYWLLLL